MTNIEGLKGQPLPMQQREDPKILEERERCARIADKYAYETGVAHENENGMGYDVGRRTAAHDIAALIRNRP